MQPVHPRSGHGARSLQNLLRGPVPTSGEGKERGLSTKDCSDETTFGEFDMKNELVSICVFCNRPIKVSEVYFKPHSVTCGRKECDKASLLYDEMVLKKNELFAQIGVVIKKRKPR